MKRKSTFLKSYDKYFPKVVVYIMILLFVAMLAKISKGVTPPTPPGVSRIGYGLNNLTDGTQDSLAAPTDTIEVDTTAIPSFDALNDSTATKLKLSGGTMSGHITSEYRYGLDQYTNITFTDDVAGDFATLNAKFFYNIFKGGTGGYTIGADSVRTNMEFYVAGDGWFDGNLYFTTNEYISQSSGDLTFTDANTGSKTLAQLATGGAGTVDSTRLGNGLKNLSQAQDSLAAPMDTIEVDTGVVATIDALNDSTATKLKLSGGAIVGTVTLTGNLEGGGSAARIAGSFESITGDTLKTDITNAKMYTDGSNNLVFVDGVTSAKTLAQLAAGSAPDVTWDTLTTGDSTVLIMDNDTTLLIIDLVDSVAIEPWGSDVLILGKDGGITVVDSLTADSIYTEHLVVNNSIVIPTGSIGSTEILNQSIVGDDIDSTSESFVFDGAFHKTSAEPDSAYITANTAGDSVSALTLDRIVNPAANKNFTMTGYQLAFNYTNPTTGDGAFEIQASGNFDGDLIHVHQHTGSPLTDADLLHLEADNSGVVPLRSISGGDTNAVFVLGLVQMDSLDVSGVARIDGNITTSGTVDGVDLAAFNTDVAADSAAQNAAKDSVGEWDNRSYPDASVTAKGIASFNGGDFSDASGVITIDNDGHLHTGISISGLGSADISGLDSTNIATNSLSMTGDLHTFTKAELEGQSSDVADYAEADGDTWTGVHDMGGATSLEIPNSKNPTTDAKGEIAIDNNNGIRYYDSALAAQVVQPSLCTFQWGVDQPDILENDSVQVMDVLTDLYPFGIKLVSLGMKHKQPFAYSVTFWEYTHVCADSGTESQLEGAIATGATECTAEDDGTLTDSDIAAGSVIKVLLPATDVPDLTLWGTFYVKTGD